MNFISTDYLIFLAIFLFLFYTFPSCRLVIAFLASCYFYICYVPIYILILFTLITVDYFSALWIEQATQKRRTSWLLISLAMNIGILSAFKFFYTLSPHGSLSTMGQIIQTYGMPIGLSFHTFQSMSYVIDVYYGRQRAERHWGVYALYVMYFFQLMAGPIERSQHLLPQIKTIKPFDLMLFKKGLFTAFSGYLLKMVVADRVSPLVDAVYNQSHHYNGITLLFATFLFSFQIYGDFAGYTAIARGSAMMAGIDIIQNFQRPYLARSLTDFWHRWHISLSTWFRDYVYIPLGGRRKGVPRWCLNVLLTFLLSGIWHGSGLHFAIWGFFHGIGLIIERGLAWLKKSWSLHEAVGTVSQIVCTFFYVGMGWIFFRSNTVENAWGIVRRIATEIGHPSMGDVRSTLSSLPIPTADIVIAVSSVGCLVLLEVIRPSVGWWDWLRQRSRPVRWATYYAAVALFALFCKTDARSFIYFQF